MPFPPFNKIAEGIAMVFHLWRHDPKSIHLAENQPHIGFEHKPGKWRSAPSKPKRVRPPRGKPLTVADIVAGAFYVPKRGNNRTPNIVVERFDGRDVRYRQRDASNVCNVEVFLSLVSRRIDL